MIKNINIYLICAEIDGEKLYKIGFTKRDINIRLKEFKTGNAADLYLVDSFKSKWGTTIEASLHKSFKDKKISGEWFKLEEIDILSFKEKCQFIHDNLNFIEDNNLYFIEKNNKVI